MLGKKGAVGNVVDSCNESNACRHGGGFEGSIQTMNTSCNAYKACYDAGRFSVRSIFSDLSNCCNAAYECMSANQASLAGACPGVRSARFAWDFFKKMIEVRSPHHYCFIVFWVICFSRSTYSLLRLRCEYHLLNSLHAARQMRPPQTHQQQPQLGSPFIPCTHHHHPSPATSLKSAPSNSISP